MFGPDEDEEDYVEDEFAEQFVDGVTSDTEYSFLVFQGIELHYIDEYGVKHATNIK